MQSRQPIYVEVSMADLFAPLDGPAGGGGQPERAPDPVKTQSQPPVSGFSDQVAPQAVAATPAVNGVPGSAIGSGGSGTGGSGGGTGGGTGGGHGSGKGTGVGPGTGTGTGTTRGPRIVDGGRPDYPENARAKGWEGTVKLQILVNTDGRVEDVRIVAGSGYTELDQTAQRAVRSWRFSPALKNGSPVAAWATVPVVFDLR
jgi:protein TonB